RHVIQHWQVHGRLPLHERIHRPHQLPGQEDQGADSATSHSGCDLSTPRPKDGELLIRAKYISVDPFQRSRIEAATRYGKPMPLNETVLGRMVGEIVLSRHPNYREGQIVHGMLGWQEYAISDGGTNIENYGPGITVVDPDLAPISTALGIMGMPGATAY